MANRPLPQTTLKMVTKDDLRNCHFFQMPKWLKGMNISNNAKLLYTYALSRIHLSIRNDWVDDEGNVFCWYRRYDMAKDLNTSVRSVSRYLKELKNEGLLSCVQVYAQMPAQIYLYYPAETVDEKKHVSRSSGTEKCRDNIVHPPKVPGQKVQSAGTKSAKWQDKDGTQEILIRNTSRNDTTALDEVDSGVLQALSFIKGSITEKDKKKLLSLQRSYGKEALLRSIISVQAQGTTIHSLTYLETVLKNEKTSSFDSFRQNKQSYLGVQPIETRYTKEEMDEIIARKIEEVRKEENEGVKA